MQSPHLRIVFSEDAQEWDRYVTDCLSRCIQTNAANSQLNVHHEKLENVTCEPASANESTVQSQIICILILSPGLLQLLKRRPLLAEHIRSLGARVVCILCGVRRSDLLQQLYQSMSTTATNSSVDSTSSGNLPPASVLRNALQWMHLWHMLDAEQQSDQMLPQLLLVIGRLLKQQQQTPITVSSLKASSDCSSSNQLLTSSTNHSTSPDSLQPEGEVYSLLSALTSGRPITDTSVPLNSIANSSFQSTSCAASSCSSSGVSSVGSQVSSIEANEKPSFKLHPHKVTQDCNKVLLILQNPMVHSTKSRLVVQVTWKNRCLFTSSSSSSSSSPSNNSNDSSLSRLLPVKTINSYTLQICIPDDLLTQSRELMVSLSLNEKSFGQRPLKSECRQSQLNHLLTHLISPSIALQQAFACNSMSELDSQLSLRFQQNTLSQSTLELLGLQCLKPIERPLIDLLDDNEAELTSQKQISQDKEQEQVQNINSISSSSSSSSSNESTVVCVDSPLESPTLVHFAAQFGLNQLAEQILKLAGSQSRHLCSIRNKRGLNALQLAYRAKNTQLVQLLRPHFHNKSSANESGEAIVDDCNLDLDLSDHLPADRSLSSPQLRPGSEASSVVSTCTDQSLASIEADARVHSPTLSLIEQAQQQDYCNLLPLTKPVRITNTLIDSIGDYDVLVCEKPRKAIPPLPVSMPESFDANEGDVVDGARSLYINSSVVSLNANAKLASTNSSPAKSIASNQSNNSKDRHLSESQLELVHIMNAFKYGSHSIEQIESMFKQWQEKYKVNVSETAETPSTRHQESPESAKNPIHRSIVSSSKIETSDKLRKSASLDSVHVLPVKVAKSARTADRDVEPNSNRRLADWLHQLAGKLRHRSGVSPKLMKKDKHSKSSAALLHSSSSSLARSSYSSHPLPSKNSLMLRGARLNEMRQKNTTLPAGSSPPTAKELMGAKSATLPPNSQPSSTTHSVSTTHLSSNLISSINRASLHDNLNVSTNTSNASDSSWNLFTLSDDQQTIICNRLKSNVSSDSKAKSQDSPSKSSFKSYVSTGTGKLPMPLPPQDDYDRVPLGPPVPVTKRTAPALI